MLKRALALVIILLTHQLAYAGPIEFKGYSRENSSNVVTGGGLEWLQWTVTKGMTIDSALKQYTAQGWRLANNEQMATLFNTFSVWQAELDSFGRTRPMARGPSAREVCSSSVS